MLQRSAAAAARGAHHVLLPPTPRAVMTASTASHALAQICRTVHARAIHPPRTAALPQMQTLSLSNPEDTPPILPSFSEEKALKSHRDLHNYEVPAEPPSVAQIFGKMSINWFPGHMHAAKLALQERVSKCHLVLEVRDARIPFSSGNPDFDAILHQKKRILVFNKSDLADPASFERVKRHFELERGIQCIFMAGDPVVQKRGGRERSESGAGGERERQRERKISASHAVNRTQLKQLHSLIQSTLGPRKFSSVPPVLLVVGFPNVGKSTLINAFRAFSKSAAGKNAGKSYLDATKEDTKRMQKGGAAKVGAEPGVTRGISGFLVSSTVSSSSANASASAGGDKGKQTDKLFLLDTPGIMLPFIPSTPQGVELGLKLSAINSIADLVIGEEALVRYTLWILNRTQQFGYVQMLHPHLAQPTSNLDQLLMAVFRAKHSRTVHKSALFREVQQRMKENEGRGVEEPINELSDSTAAAAAPSSESASSSRTGPQSIAQLTTEELHLCTSWWIKTFRRGEFGRLVLDHIPAPTKKLTTTNK